MRLEEMILAVKCLSNSEVAGSRRKKIRFNFVILKHPLLSTQFILEYLYNKMILHKNFRQKNHPTI